MSSPNSMAASGELRVGTPSCQSPEQGPDRTRVGRGAAWSTGVGARRTSDSEVRRPRRSAPRARPSCGPWLGRMDRRRPPVGAAWASAARLHHAEAAACGRRDRVETAGTRRRFEHDASARESLEPVRDRVSVGHDRTLFDSSSVWREGADPCGACAEVESGARGHLQWGRGLRLLQGPSTAELRATALETGLLTPSHTRPQLGDAGVASTCRSTIARCNAGHRCVQGDRRRRKGGHFAPAVRPWAKCPSRCLDRRARDGPIV